MSDSFFDLLRSRADAKARGETPARKPDAPSPSTPPSTTATASPTTTATADPFFAALKGRLASGPLLGAAAPAAPGVDIRAAATEALRRTGWFDSDPNAPAPAAGTSPFVAPAVSRPSGGLFKGVERAGKKKGPQKERVVKAGAVSLADLFGLAAEPEVHPASKLAEAQRREGVSDSFELQRILKIRRRFPPVHAPDKVPDLTERFKRPAGTMKLWPIQSAALAEMEMADGLLGPLPVGAGKLSHLYWLRLLSLASEPCYWCRLNFERS